MTHYVFQWIVGWSVCHFFLFLPRCGLTDKLKTVGGEERRGQLEPEAYRVSMIVCSIISRSKITGPKIISKPVDMLLIVKITILLSQS